MAVSTIWQQPYWNQIYSAYRPIEFVVQGDPNQWVYCDVYIEGTYYKTLMSNVRWAPGPGTDWLYYFDIQDAVQEWLDWELQQAPNLFGTFTQSPKRSFAQVQCQFRGSTQDTYGIITPDGPEPVQATLDTAAVPGGGIYAIGCVVIDGALQHEERSVMVEHLKFHRVLTLGFPTGNYLTINNNYGIYPLSHTKRMKVTMEDWGHWTGYVDELGYQGLPIHWARLFVLSYHEFAGGFQVLNTDMGHQFAINHVSIFGLPYGPKSLFTMPGYGTIPWHTMKQYYVYIKLVSGPQNGQFVFSTPLLELCKCQRRYRFWWRNYLGHFEQIDFEEFSEFTEVKSGMTERPLEGPISGKRKFGKQRTNVTSNERIVVYECFAEDELPRITELLSSNRVYRETSRPETENYQNGDFLPVIIKDSSVEKIKMEKDGRWYYEVMIEMEMANDNIIPRN